MPKPTEKKKLTLKKRTDKEKAKQEFIEEPERKIKEKSEYQFPWDAPEVNERVIKVFNVRLPEPDHLKIRWIVKKSNEFNSVHEFFLKTIQDKIREEISKI